MVAEQEFCRYVWQMINLQGSALLGYQTALENIFKGINMKHYSVGGLDIIYFM